MNLDFDAASGNLQNVFLVATDTNGVGSYGVSAAVNSLSGKLGSTIPVTIRLLGNGTLVASNGPLKLGFKPEDKFDASTWEAYTDVLTPLGTTGDAALTYTGSLALTADALYALFPDNSDGTSATQVTIMGALLNGAQELSTFDFTVQNNLFKNTETPPAAAGAVLPFPSSTAMTTAVAEAATALQTTDIGTTAGKVAAGDDAAFPSLRFPTVQAVNQGFDKTGLSQSSVAFGNLLASVPAAGGEFRLQAGHYLLAGEFFCPNPFKLVGEGGSYNGAGTIFFTTSSTDTLLSLDGNTQVLTDIGFHNASTPTAGCALKFINGAQANLTNVWATGFYEGIVYQDGYYYRFAGCHVHDSMYCDIRLNSLANFDNGDQVISDSWFGPLGRLGNPESCVLLETGGGLRVIGCKSNGFTSGQQAGKSKRVVWIRVPDAAGSSDLFVLGNSFENFTETAVVVEQQNSGSNARYNNILIYGNEIAYGGSGIDISYINDGGIIDDNLFRELSGFGINADGSNLVIGGANNYIDVPVCVQNPVGGTNTTILPQVRAEDGVYYQGVPGALPQLRFARTISNDVATPTAGQVLAQIGVGQYGAGTIRLRLEGSVYGVGSYSLTQTRTFTRGNSNTYPILVADDDPLPEGDAAAHVSIAYDTISYAGLIVVRASSTGGGLNGTCELQGTGNVSLLASGPGHYLDLNPASNMTNGAAPDATIFRRRDAETPVETARTTSTLAVDPYLSVPVQAGTYRVQLDAWIAAPASDSFSNGVKLGCYGWTNGGGTSLRLTTTMIQGANQTPATVETTVPTVSLLTPPVTGAFLLHIQITGQIESTGDGVVALGWAQQNAYPPAPYVMRAGSTLHLHRVG